MILYSWENMIDKRRKKLGGQSGFGSMSFVKQVEMEQKKAVDEDKLNCFHIFLFSSEAGMRFIIMSIKTT